jgi:hypothetical protein
MGQERLRLGKKREDVGIPFRFPSTLPPSSAWVSKEVAGLASEGPLSFRAPRDELGRDMAEFGREPYTIVLEKVELAGREVVDPGRDIVDEANELPRA